MFDTKKVVDEIMGNRKQKMKRAIFSSDDESHIINYDGYGYVCSCGNRYNSSTGARLHIEAVER